MPHIRPQSTVDSALWCSDLGFPDRQNAEIHAVAVKTIRRWRRLYQRRGLPRGARQAGVGAACKPGSRARQRSKPGAVMVELGWKHWPCLFPQHGPGRKHTRRIALEPWQIEIVRRRPGPFLRGLFHSDGCRSMNRVVRRFAGEDREYAYPRYFFKNASDDIRELACWALELCDIAWRASGPRTISVARTDDVAALDLLVGPKT